MFLNQIELVVIVCDNKDRSFVTIKRARKSNIDDVFRILNFVNDHVINIKDMFLNKKKIIIIYE